MIQKNFYFKNFKCTGGLDRPPNLDRVKRSVPQQKFLSPYLRKIMTQVGNCDIEGVYFQNYVRKVIDKYNYYYYKFDDNYNFFLPNSKFLIRCSSNIMMFDRSNCYDMMSS